MRKTTRTPPLLRGRHRCEHPSPAKSGDIFECYCCRSWRATELHGRIVWVARTGDRT